MPSPAPTPRGQGQGGFTLVELVMVVMLMGLLGVALHTSLDSLVRVTRTTQDKSSASDDVRTAMEAMARDLRAANPIDDTQSNVVDYQKKVQFSVYCSTPGTASCGNDRLRRVTYQVVDNGLERVVGSTTTVLVGPNAQTAVPVDQRLGAVVNPASEPVFRYFDRTGAPLDISGGDSSVTTRRVHDCTRSVEVHLKVVSEPRKPATAYNLVTTLDLRNFSEVIGC
ncbi:MAG: prepilin-type N-terminal cleavage/methylation domain-containing protein [Actinomycetota bacterium]|nr:prepilin-type N-terminal cleavage/methylation domain-containing protein [Actinomycetota bacterium]MDQ3680730.1 prepilin-type N-terminal cleavage/methylation domain-containing protein [Actinomycetota bacterium]